MASVQPAVSASAASAYGPSQAPTRFPSPPARPSAVLSSSSLPQTRTAPRANYFHYDQRSVKARIDPEVPLDEVLRQLCASPQLAVSEPPALFALREKESGVLVTADNMRELLARASTFQLVSSPMLEAVELIDKLSSSDPAVLKPATFALRTHVQERAFLDAFLARGGVDALAGAVRRSSGNTLAYALLSLQTVLELVEGGGWVGLDGGFGGCLVDIVATGPLVNIARPATAILRRLASQPILPPTYPSTSAAPRSSSHSGLVTVLDAVLAQSAFLRTVVERLTAGDVAVTDLSLALLDVLLRGSVNLGDLRLAETLEGLDAWRAVGKLLDGSKGADSSLLLSLQASHLASLRLTLETPVAEEHYPVFDALWIASGLEDTDESNRWRRLGFLSESPQYEFARPGLLGLKALRRFADDSQNEFSQTLRDQAVRPESRRCPVSTVSNTALLLLAEHFHLTAPAPSPTALSPYPFRFYELHALVVQCLVRLWTDAGATLADLDRLAALGRSQVAFVLGGSGGERTWFEVRRGFLTAEYRAVRERQMREMEVEDDLLSKAPVRTLRARLYHESYEFVRSQRIACLHDGAWFLCGPPAPSRSTPSPAAGPAAGRRPSGAGGRHDGRTWRFYRLAANRRALQWCEAREQREGKPAAEELTEKIDLASIKDVVPSGSTGGPQRPVRVSQLGGLARPGSTASAADGRPERGTTTSRRSFLSSSKDSSSHTGAAPALRHQPPSLSFALVGASGPLVELTAPSPAVYSEWLDGLSFVRDGAAGGATGSIATRETADYVQALTEIGVKVKMLDLSGEKVEVLAKEEVKGVPAHADFFYADSL